MPGRLSKSCGMCDPQISRISKKMFKFRPKFLDLYASIYGSFVQWGPLIVITINVIIRLMLSLSQSPGRIEKSKYEIIWLL
jgi:hypothetical protein